MDSEEPLFPYKLTPVMEAIEESNFLDTLDGWKRRKIRDGDLLFKDAVDSLGTSQPLVEARKIEQSLGARWSVSTSSERASVSFSR